MSPSTQDLDVSWAQHCIFQALILRTNVTYFGDELQWNKLRWSLLSDCYCRLTCYNYSHFIRSLSSDNGRIRWHSIKKPICLANDANGHTNPDVALASISLAVI